jgi:hypothetical protein
MWWGFFQCGGLPRQGSRNSRYDILSAKAMRGWTATFSSKACDVPVRGHAHMKQIVSVDQARQHGHAFAGTFC